MSQPARTYPAVPSVQVVSAEVKDVPVLALFNRRLIEDERQDIRLCPRMSGADLEARMKRWLISSEYEAYLFWWCEHGITQHCIGYALVRDLPDQVYLRHFFIDREYRAQGLGKAALKTLLSQVLVPNKKIRLDVLNGNESAVAFWHACGFKKYCLTMEMAGGENGVEEDRKR